MENDETMSALTDEKLYRIFDTCDTGVLLRFKNDFGGRDLIFFPGNYAIRTNSGSVQTFDRFVKDFSPTGDSGRQDILLSEIIESIQCSRFISKANGEGMRQLFTSRFVEIFTGQKNDTPANQRNKWLQVRVSLRDWNERVKDNMIFVSIQVELPKRYVDGN